MNPSLQVVQDWSALAQANKIEDAAALMADDVSVQSPLLTFTGREKWKQEIPKILKQAIVWEPFEQGETDSEVVCNGTKDLGFMKLSVKRTIEVNDEGEITSIVVKRK